MRLGIEARAVSFKYRGRRTVLRELSFEAAVGVTGLLGPNGAGKTTLMNLVATLRRPSSGSLSVMGRDVVLERDRVRAAVGYLPQRFDVLPFATVSRNVEYSAWAKGLDLPARASAVQRALELVDLWDRRGEKARTLSGGMRQRLGIACAIVHQPPVIVLDEPTVGLDPVQRVGVRRLIQSLGETSTVLVSTHLLEDLTSLTSDVLVLNEGLDVFQGSVQELEQIGSVDSSVSSAAEAGYAAVLAGGQL